MISRIQTVSNRQLLNTSSDYMLAFIGIVAAQFFMGLPEGFESNSSNVWLMAAIASIIWVMLAATGVVRGFFGIAIPVFLFTAMYGGEIYFTLGISFGFAGLIIMFYKWSEGVWPSGKEGDQDS